MLDISLTPKQIVQISNFQYALGTKHLCTSQHPPESLLGTLLLEFSYVEYENLLVRIGQSFCSDLSSV